jgi:hypothetical protein
MFKFNQPCHIMSYKLYPSAVTCPWCVRCIPSRPPRSGREDGDTQRIWLRRVSCVRGVGERYLDPECETVVSALSYRLIHLVLKTRPLAEVRKFPDFHASGTSVPFFNLITVTY